MTGGSAFVAVRRALATAFPASSDVSYPGGEGVFRLLGCDWPHSSSYCAPIGDNHSQISCRRLRHGMSGLEGHGRFGGLTSSRVRFLGTKYGLSNDTALGGWQGVGKVESRAKAVRGALDGRAGCESIVLGCAIQVLESMQRVGALTRGEQVSRLAAALLNDVSSLGGGPGPGVRLTRNGNPNRRPPTLATKATTSCPEGAQVGHPVSDAG
jgi:hypothetical protein